MKFLRAPACETEGGGQGQGQSVCAVQGLRTAHPREM
jgi:hypothetical protein